MTSLTPGPTAGGGLAAPPSRRGWRVTAYVAGLVAVLAGLGWVATHPATLPTTGSTVRAEAPAGQPVYVGVFVAPTDFGRTLHVSGVRVRATSTAGATVVPHVCHGGSVDVTTTPQSFCRTFSGTEGTTLRAGDAVVLEVTGDRPAVVQIDRVEISYRDGLQWATQDAGSRAQVSILAR